MVSLVTETPWGGLIAEPEPERSRSMREHFASVLALGEIARDEALEEMVRSEYALNDDELRSLTASRLRGWLALGHEEAQILAGGYDRVFDRLPAAIAMRRAKIVQTVAMHDLTPAEVEGLFALIPSLIQQVPRHVDALPKNEQRPKRRRRWLPF